MLISYYSFIPACNIAKYYPKACRICKTKQVKRINVYRDMLILGEGNISPASNHVMLVFDNIP